MEQEALPRREDYENDMSYELALAAWERPIGPAMDELREAFGRHFDGVDVEAYMQEVRGE